MRYFIFFFSFFLSLKSQAQDMQIINSAADSAVMRGDFHFSIMYHKKIISDTSIHTIEKGISMYNIGCDYARIGEIDSAFLCIEMYLANKPRIDIFYDPDFYALTSDPRWKSLYDRLSKSYFKDNPGLDKDRAFELSVMKMADQAYYGDINLCESKYGRNSIEVKKVWKIKDSLNHINQSKLLAMSPNARFPKSSEIGREGVAALFIIVQHAPLEIQERYLPEIERLSNHGELSKSSFALLKDRVLVSEGKKQMYGSQVKRDSTGIAEPYPIEDEVHVNIRRKELGIPPLENYLQHFGIIYHLPEK
jgi:hypothetical protein